MFVLRFDTNGRLITPHPRACAMKATHTAEEALRCVACNPCFCLSGVPGCLYSCPQCVKYRLGGAKKARELGIENGYCDHDRWMETRCDRCKVKPPGKRSGARAPVVTPEPEECPLSLLARVAEAQPRVVKLEPDSD